MTKTISKTPTPSYILVDFENVQPRNLEILREHPFQVIVFVGANQNRIPFELAAALQKLGDAGSYIKIENSGSNALDFYIAYYIGELASKDSTAHFHIISRDKGFDPLIQHLNARRDLKIRVFREKDLGEIPQLRVSTAATHDEKIDAIVKNLRARGQSRPRKLATLSNTINSLFTENIPEAELRSIIAELEKRKLLSIRDTAVSYRLGQNK